MTADQLKASILQLAISGKLVPQLDNEPEVEQIGEIPEDIPFEIPKKWKWLKLGDFADLNIGKTHPRHETQYWRDGYNWVSIADMSKSDYGLIKTTKEQVSEEAINKVFAHKICPAGTLLMSFKLSIGKIGILDIDAVHNEEIVSILPKNFYCDVDKLFLFYVLPLCVNYIDKTNAIKEQTLNKEKLKNILVPLPLLGEQKRIVTKIKFLFDIFNISKNN